MWHKVEWMGYPMRLELTHVGLLVKLANHYTTEGAERFIYSTYKWNKYEKRFAFCVLSWNLIGNRCKKTPTHPLIGPQKIMDFCNCGSNWILNWNYVSKRKKPINPPKCPKGPKHNHLYISLFHQMHFSFFFSFFHSFLLSFFLFFFFKEGYQHIKILFLNEKKHF